MTEETVLAPSRTERWATAALLPVAGALAGWAVLTWHDAWRALDWVPLRGPAELVDRFDTWLGPWATVVIVGLGVVAGLVLVLIARGEEVTVVVTDKQVEIASGASERSYRADDVREALVDGKHLVLVADNGAELARVRTEFRWAALADAFRAHGYDWTGAS